MAKTNDDFKITTVEKIGVLSKSESGKSTLELRKTEVKNTTKWDIRSWWLDNEGEEKCGKGIRLTDDELYKLGELISGMDSFD